MYITTFIAAVVLAGGMLFYFSEEKSKIEKPDPINQSDWSKINTNNSENNTNPTPQPAPAQTNPVPTPESPSELDTINPTDPLPLRKQNFIVKVNETYSIPDKITVKKGYVITVFLTADPNYTPVEGIYFSGGGTTSETILPGKNTEITFTAVSDFLLLGHSNADNSPLNYEIVVDVQ